MPTDQDLHCTNSEEPGLKVIKKSCSTQLSMKFYLLISVKMLTIVGILTFMCRMAFQHFMCRKNSIVTKAYLSLKKPEVLDIFICMSI